jgi:hypothetical protein
VTASGGMLEYLRAGDAIVVQLEGADLPALRSFATGLAADPEHVVVVLGFQADYPASAWAPVLPVLASSPGTLRLVPGGPALTTTVPTGQWLADLLGRAVLAHNGRAVPAARGALFIPPADGTGWVRILPGQPMAAGSRRFPAPPWTTPVLERVTVLSETATAEPLPGGAWIHPAATGDEHRQRLISWLARRDDRIYVVLGHPGAPPPTTADIERFWRLLSPAVRAAVAFVPYGPIAVPGGPPSGQALANRFGEPVTVCTGLPWSGHAANDPIAVSALRADGSPGWQPFATELRYHPVRPGAGAPPTVISHRPPVAGLAETSPGVYAYEQDTVVEVVQGGLWLRRAAGPPGPAIPRSHPLSPDEPLIFVDTDAPESGPITQNLLSALDPEVRSSCRVLPSADERPDGRRAQPVPGAEACVIPPPQGLTRERAWLRRTLARQYDAVISLVERVLTENPGIQGDSSLPTADLLTDLAALRLYLSGHAQSLDAAVRGGTVGPHVPFARCVASGLRHMPSYRGATRLRVTLADAEWQWYEARQVVTEWAFCAAVTNGRARLPGDAEFRIWSMTARQTHLLEPRVPSQVLFLPGTRFKVLRLDSTHRREVLLRELSPDEIGADGQLELGHVPLDAIALAGLDAAARAWREAEPGEELPSGYEHRFGDPPGLR